MIKDQKYFLKVFNEKKEEIFPTPNHPQINTGKSIILQLKNNDVIKTGPVVNYSIYEYESNEQLKKFKIQIETLNSIYVGYVENIVVNNETPVKNTESVDDIKQLKRIYSISYVFILKILLRLKYLDEEEIALYLSKIRNEDEWNITVQEIENFRNLSKYNREKLVNAFRETKLGKVTLAQDQYAKRYINLLVNSNITKETKIIPCNKEEYLTAIEINNDFKGDLKTVLKKILE